MTRLKGSLPGRRTTCARIAQFVGRFRGGCLFPGTSSGFVALVIIVVPTGYGRRRDGASLRSGGTVAAYAWDILAGGLSYEALQAEMRELGVAVLLSSPARLADALRDL